jgi:hypothetical protein
MIVINWEASGNQWCWKFSIYFLRNHNNICPGGLRKIRNVPFSVDGPEYEAGVTTQPRLSVVSLIKA